MNVLAINADSGNWLKVFRSINTLLEYGVTVFWLRQKAEISGKVITPGAFIIPRESLLMEPRSSTTLEKIHPLKNNEIEIFLHKNNITSIIKGELDKPVNIYQLKPTKIAMYQDSGCYNHAMVLASSGFDVDWVTGSEIAAGALDKYDVLMSGGGGGAKKANINRENLLLASMGVDGAKKLSEFVKTGGAYFGCCGGSYIGSVVRERFMNWWHPAKRYATMMNVEDWHIDEFSDSGFKSPGQGTYLARNTSPDNPVMYGMPEKFSVTHWNGPFWNLIEGAIELASSANPLIKCEEVKPENFTPSEFYYKQVDADDETIKETGIYKACVEHKVAIAQGYYGLGVVVLSGSHPEMAPFYGVELDVDTLWDSARLLSNAVFFSSAQGQRERKDSVIQIQSMIIPFEPQLRQMQKGLQRCLNLSENLKKKGVKPKTFWLEPQYYNRAYGLTSEEMYVQMLNNVPSLVEKVLHEFEIMDELIAEIIKVREQVLKDCAHTDKESSRILELIKDKGFSIMQRYYKILGDLKEPIWNQSGHQRFLGIYTLLNNAEEKFKKALTRYDELANSSLDNFSRDSLVDNPYTNLSSASSTLGNVLKLLWVHRLSAEKYLSVWNLIKTN